MTTRKVLVSGGGGFLGRHLMRRLLSEGAEVTCILKGGEHPEGPPVGFDAVRVVWHDGSMTDMSSIVQASQPDSVFHLASLFLSQHLPTHIDPLVESNVLLGTQLLEAIAVHAEPYPTFVNVGTSWQHFNGADYDPVNLYAATKQAFENILQYYVSALGLQAVTLKLFDTYGPDDPRPKLVNLIRAAAASGDHICMSPGEQKLDLVYVEDVVSALVIAESGLRNGSIETGESFSVSSGQRLSIREIVDTYSRATGQRAYVSWGDRAYRPREVMNPWDGGTQVPGWAPEWSLTRGFREINGE